MKQKHHIIPLHMGGPNTPANITEITVLEHSLAHKKLYEEHGNWQDYVLWHGLAKLIDNLESVTVFMEAGGRTGTKFAYTKDNKANNEELSRKIQDAIGKAGLKAELATVAMRPEIEIALEGDQAESMQKLLDALENLDDVQEVFTNASL